MNKVLIAAGILIAGAGVARSQDVQWVESRFHRVFLRNGNVLDGQLVSTTDKAVTLSIRGGEFRVHADQVDRVELVKIRTVRELPKTVASVLPSGKLAPAKPVPAIDPVVRNRVDRALSQMVAASAADRDGITRDLARRPGIGAYLASRMEETKDDVLPYVGRALWELQEEESAPYVAAALESDRQSVVSQAVLLSARLDNSATAGRIRRFLDDRRPRVRAATIEALRVIGDERSLPDFIRFMEAEEDVVRAAAITTSLDLGRRFGRMNLVSDGLRQAMERARGSALSDLLDAAGRSGCVELALVVVRSLRDGEGEVRAKAAAALGQLKAPVALEAVNQRLSVEDYVPAQIQLVRTAGILRSPSSVDPVIYLLRSTDEDLVRECVSVLKKITKQSFGASYGDWISWWEQVRR